MLSSNQVSLPVAFLFAIVFSRFVDGFIFPMDVKHLVVRNKTAAIGQFPHQVSVQLEEPDMSFRHACSGSIITNRFILTVAHCENRFYLASQYRIVVGATNLEKSGTAYRVEEWIPHEDFSADTTIRNDIALIRVEKIKFFPVSSIFTIPLGVRFIRGGGSAVVSGWDRGQELPNLEFVRMTTMTNDNCRSLFEERKTPVHDFDTICAISGKDGNEIREGQSGDPMVYQNRLIGILSWIHPSSGKNGVLLPAGFTRISTYIDWITDRLPPF